VHAAPAWDTVKACPPALMTAERGEVLVLAEAVKGTLPLPEPGVLPSVIQAAPVLAVQVHPLAVVTVKLPLPPAAPTAWLVGEIA